MRIAGLLLAAGLSRRFGVADKLAADLHGLPLAAHAAATLGGLGLAANILVSARVDRRWPDFTVVHNPAPELGLSRSIALGVAAAREVGGQAVLIALADMPFVSAAHYRRLIAAAHGERAIIASTDGNAAMPPALFGADWFGALESLSGDRGAGALLGDATLVAAPPHELADIDTPGTLDAARARR